MWRVEALAVLGWWCLANIKFLLCLFELPVDFAPLDDNVFTADDDVGVADVAFA